MKTVIILMINQKLKYYHWSNNIKKWKQWSYKHPEQWWYKNVHSIDYESFSNPVPSAFVTLVSMYFNGAIGQCLESYLIKGSLPYVLNLANIFKNKFVSIIPVLNAGSNSTTNFRKTQYIHIVFILHCAVLIPQQPESLRILAVR